jgi:hypothetical protein
MQILFVCMYLYAEVEQNPILKSVNMDVLKGGHFHRLPCTGRVPTVGRL